MDIKAITNEPIHLLTVGPVRIHARALPMADAVDWSGTGDAARRAVESATDYVAMGRAAQLVIAALRDYPSLTEGAKNELPAEVFEQMTRGQAEGALAALLEINDPFVGVRRKREETTKRGQEMLATLPADERAKMMEAALKAVSVSSPENSDLIHGKLPESGHGPSGGRE